MDFKDFDLHSITEKHKALREESDLEYAHGDAFAFVAKYYAKDLRFKSFCEDLEKQSKACYERAQAISGEIVQEAREVLTIARKVSKAAVYQA